MLQNAKRIYALAGYTVEHRAKGWFFKKTYTEDDWHGPYSSETSVSLMLARQLKREIVKRDAVHQLPE
jgi:hypothetical protein